MVDDSEVPDCFSLMFQAISRHFPRLHLRSDRQPCHALAGGDQATNSMNPNGAPPSVIKLVCLSDGMK
jgi:hypothetical protein